MTRNDLPSAAGSISSARPVATITRPSTSSTKGSSTVNLFHRWRTPAVRVRRQVIRDARLRARSERKSEIHLALSHSQTPPVAHLAERIQNGRPSDRQFQRESLPFPGERFCGIGHGQRSFPKKIYRLLPLALARNVGIVPRPKAKTESTCDFSV